MPSTEHGEQKSAKGKNGNDKIETKLVMLELYIVETDMQKDRFMTGKNLCTILFCAGGADLS